MANFIRLYSVLKGTDIKNTIETCYNIELTNETPSHEDMTKLYSLLSYSGTYDVSPTSLLKDIVESDIIEFGSQMTMTTSWATNVMSIFEKSEINFITRIERSFRTSNKDILNRMFDKISHVIYDKPITSFTSKIKNTYEHTDKSYSEIFTINPADISIYSSIYNLGMTKTDIEYFRDLFEVKLKRRLTNAELLTIGQLSSEHSRHRFFNGKYNVVNYVIDDKNEAILHKTVNYTGEITVSINSEISHNKLMDTIKIPLMINENNSVLAFCDNASAIKGYPDIIQSGYSINSQFELADNCESDNSDSPNDIYVQAGFVSNRFIKQYPRTSHPTLKVETHNFPTLIAPFQGAATGVGGRIRDTLCVGQGGTPIAGIAGYFVGNLGLGQSWETLSLPKDIPNSPLEILIKASDGASDYGNKFGESIIAGVTRAYGDTIQYREIDTPDGIYNGLCIGKVKVIESRCEWLKPVMLSGGIGFVDDTHLEKTSKMGMCILRVGGPAYRIGIGGSSASSRVIDPKNTKSDHNAVQRGDPEMANKVSKFIMTCIQMGASNPIDSIHDQGAGGPANVITEIISPHGGVVNLHYVKRGDSDMSDLEVWISEHQEQVTILAHSVNVQILKEIAERENVPIENIGMVSNTGDVTAITCAPHKNDDDVKSDDVKSDDVKSDDDVIKMVDLPIDDIINKLPVNTYTLKNTIKIWAVKDSNWYTFDEFDTFEQSLEKVLSNVQVGSKQFLTNKVDRSVSGLISQQQCVGINQIPLSDYASVAINHYGAIGMMSSNDVSFPGVVTAIGEQSIKGLYNVDKMVRLSVIEMLTNMIWAYIEDMCMIKCSANWMWANESTNDKFKLHKAVKTLSETLSDLGIAIDGGKDSLSMSVKTSDGEIKSPNSLVLTGYVTTPDIRLKVNPGFVGNNSKIIHINLSGGVWRLGGSVFSQCYNKMNAFSGSDVPDFDPRNFNKFIELFAYIQQLIKSGKIMSGHDVSDGGLITGLVEMSFPNGIGFQVVRAIRAVTHFEYFFSEEPGILMEVDNDIAGDIIGRLKNIGYHNASIIGTTGGENIIVSYNGHHILNTSVNKVKAYWETTSFQIEKLQANPECIKMEMENNQNSWVDPYIYVIPPDVMSLLKNIEASDPLRNVILRNMPYNDSPCVAVIREEGCNSDREMKAALIIAGFQTCDIHMNDIFSGKITLDAFNGVVFVGGFSYSDVLGAAQGWATCINSHPEIKEQFDRFYKRPDTFSLGICNGCQLMGLLNWVPFNSRFIQNTSGRFESRYSLVTVMPNSSIMLHNMVGLQFGIWTAHGEGKYFSEELKDIYETDKMENYDMYFPVRYVDHNSKPTSQYPHNPNGSPNGITSIVSYDGRHLAVMPHPERSILNWQLAYVPTSLKQQMGNLSPWAIMFSNAFNWCCANK
jgi:phosphoribosylformylglycinamidine synthase